MRHRVMLNNRVKGHSQRFVIFHIAYKNPPVVVAKADNYGLISVMGARKTIPVQVESGDLGDLSQTPAKIAAIRADLSEQYNKQHSRPWIIAYSGGKDSTLLLQLVFETVLAVPPEKRKRTVHIIANDTKVESPLVINHLNESIAEIRRAIGKHNLPMSATITRPYTDDTFWVNVIGRGYIPPTRNFRWCTDRLKIRPTTEFITRLTRTHKHTILLVGTRKAESANRKRRMEKHASETRSKMSPHNTIPNCKIFPPLAELTDNEVWATLLQSRPPWGGTHRKLITLYRNAGGGECPLVLTKEDAPSCGTTSPRFGCWTCTVINKDRSLGGLINSGHDELEPLYDFREWLLALREDDKNRMRKRRNGSTKYRENGSLVRGPFTMTVRRQIRDGLEVLEGETGMELISHAEKDIIEEIWRVDEAQYECRLKFARVFSKEATL